MKCVMTGKASAVSLMCEIHNICYGEFTGDDVETGGAILQQVGVLTFIVVNSVYC